MILMRSNRFLIVLQFAFLIWLPGLVPATETAPLVCELVLVDGLIRGQVDVGEVVAGSRQTRRLRLVNTLPKSIAFDVVAPTCNCVQVAIPRSELAQGQAVEGTIELTLPQKRGQHTIASVKLTHSSNELNEIRITIDGTIQRPVEFPVNEFNVRVREGESFQLDIPFQIDPIVDLADLKVSVLPSGMDFAVKREDSASGVIRVEFANVRFDDSHTYRVSVASERFGTKFTDQIVVNLVDETATRVLPCSVELDGSEIRVMFVRQSGLDRHTLKVQTTGGKPIAHEASFIGNNMARIQILANAVDEGVGEIRIFDQHGSASLTVTRTDSP